MSGGPFDGPFSVWTYNEDPDWLKSHSGVPDMLIVDGLGLTAAHTVRERIEMIASTDAVEIRNVAGEIVYTARSRDLKTNAAVVMITSVGPRPARRTDRPRRRPLGNREA